ncbi:MAG: pilus assembly protein [Eubacterium sp.]|nr:pilus assembly protein [Eubacterium sp.]
MRSRKKGRKESGQAIVEFALVLPLFLLLVMGILDFGWLFYNYISFENCAHNAARVACVEYTECCVDDDKMPRFGRTFDPRLVENNVGDEEYTDEERHIVKIAMSEMPKTVNVESIKISYTYDDDMKNDLSDYAVELRSTGDVKVEVKGKMHVLTPVLGVFSDNMEREMTATSIYKVETHPTGDDDE